jgi:hypothetical protein
MFSTCVILWYFRFPWWFGTLSAGILTVVCACLTFYHEQKISMWVIIVSITIYAFMFHGAVSVIENAVAAKGTCETIHTIENSWYLLCRWPYSLLIYVLRDGLYFIVVIYLIRFFQMPHSPTPYYILLRRRLLNPPLVPNHRRQRDRRSRRRRSPFVIRYIILRRGQIRRRRRRSLRN